MCKPRFPLSVERCFVYRAFIQESGEILESDDFKQLYMRTLSRLRTGVLYKVSGYRMEEARFEFGYSVYYEIRKGYGYSEWHTIREVGCLQVTTLSEWYYCLDTGKNLVLKERYNHE